MNLIENIHAEKLIVHYAILGEEWEIANSVYAIGIESNYLITFKASYIKKTTLVLITIFDILKQAKLVQGGDDILSYPKLRLQQPESVMMEVLAKADKRGWSVDQFTIYAYALAFRVEEEREKAQANGQSVRFYAKIGDEDEREIKVPDNF